MLRPCDLKTRFKAVLKKKGFQIISDCRHELTFGIPFDEADKAYRALYYRDWSPIETRFETFKSNSGLLMFSLSANYELGPKTGRNGLIALIAYCSSFNSGKECGVTPMKCFASTTGITVQTVQVADRLDIFDNLDYYMECIKDFICNADCWWWSNDTGEDEAPECWLDEEQEAEQEQDEKPFVEPFRHPYSGLRILGQPFLDAYPSSERVLEEIKPYPKSRLDAALTSYLLGRGWTQEEFQPKGDLCFPSDTLQFRRDELVFRSYFSESGNYNLWDLQLDFPELSDDQLYKARRLTEHAGITVRNDCLTSALGFLGDRAIDQLISEQIYKYLGAYRDISMLDGITLPEKPRRARPRPLLPDTEPAFTVGDKVSITDGPFKEFDGFVADVNAEEMKVKVMVKILGRDTPLELYYDQVTRKA